MKHSNSITLLKIFWNQFKKRKLALICIIYLIGILAPLISTHDYSETDLSRTQNGPNLENWLGTDRLGRDIYTRVIWGIQNTIVITLITIITGSFLLGISLGLAAGYFRGKVDILIMRLGEVISAFPDILLIILLAATLRPSIISLVHYIEDNMGIKGILSSGIVDYLVIGIALLPLVRGQVLSIRNAEYVQAAKAMGTSEIVILFRHILPNIISPVIVSISFSIGAIALSEVMLSFFGLGVQPPRPSLGVMIGDVTARGGASISVLRNHPEQLLAPIIVVWLMIFCWNIIGDILNDIFNPKNQY